MAARKLLSVVVLQRIRERQAQITMALRNGQRPTDSVLASHVTDVGHLIAAYETATDRLRAAQRLLNGDEK